MGLDIDAVRANFPSLRSGTIFFDNPGGTQVAQPVIDATTNYYLRANANHGGAFATSIRSDKLIHEARLAFSDFLNANSADEIIFGPNMTTLTFQMSRALGRLLARSDEILVTRLDHDANISPWLALQEHGAVVKFVDIHTDDCTLDMTDFENQLSSRTRIVAVGLASNAVGSVNPVRTIADLAHMAGAFVFVDAVHYAPHFPIDVQSLDCDFLVCSAYKVYGPHLGVMYGKYAHLDELAPYKVRPAPQRAPEKFETGTQDHEGIAGARAAVDYIASLGDKYGQEHAKDYATFEGRRLNLKTGMAALRAYEGKLFKKLIQGLQQTPGIHLYGITDPSRFEYRAPTVAFTIDGCHPRAIAEKFAAAEINVWDGNYYALTLMERLGLEEHGGAVRVGLAHYNTRQEIDRFLQVLGGIA